MELSLNEMKQDSFYILLSSTTSATIYLVVAILVPDRKQTVVDLRQERLVGPLDIKPLQSETEKNRSYNCNISP